MTRPPGIPGLPSDETVRGALASNLQKIMLRRKLRPSQLATQAGEHRSEIHYILHAERLPSVAVLARLAKVLQVPTDWLLRV